MLLVHFGVGYSLLIFNIGGLVYMSRFVVLFGGLIVGGGDVFDPGFGTAVNGAAV
jgi:hypothetical protein